MTPYEHGHSEEIRTTIVQPSLPAYRIPVFRELGRRGTIRLIVVHSAGRAGPPSVAGEGFAASVEKHLDIPVGARVLRWQRSQWDYASIARSDVLVLNWDLHNVLLAPSLLRARAHGVGTVLWGHGYSKREHWTRRSLRSAVTRLADAVVVYDDHTASALEGEIGGWVRVFTAPNTQDVAPYVTACEAAPASVGANQARCDILFVSRLEHENGVGVLLDALARIGSRVPGVAIGIVGDGRARRRLEARAQALDVAEQVRFYGAVYDVNALAGLYRNASLFCYPENAGLSLYPPMACGLPVVIGDDYTRHGPEVRAIVDGVNGATFSHGDPDDLATVLCDLLIDTRKRQTIATQAKATVLERRPLGRMVDGLVAAIEHAHLRAKARCHGRGLRSTGDPML